MKRTPVKFDINTEPTEEELSEWLKELEHYVVPFPSEEEIGAVVDRLRCYVPDIKEQQRKQTQKKPFRTMGNMPGSMADRMLKAWSQAGLKIIRTLAIAGREISFIDDTYWIVTLGLFVAGILTLWFGDSPTMTGNNPYRLVILYSPVPFVLGMLELLRGRDEEVLELELSCKSTITEVLLSRLIIICIYNILLNLLLSAILAAFGSHLELARMTMLWLTPFTLVAGISLLAASRMRGGYLVTIFSAIWMIIAMSLLSQKAVMERIEQLDGGVCGILALAGFLMMLWQGSRLLRDNGRVLRGNMNEA